MNSNQPPNGDSARRGPARAAHANEFDANRLRLQSAVHCQPVPPFLGIRIRARLISASLGDRFSSFHPE